MALRHCHTQKVFIVLAFVPKLHSLLQACCCTCSLCLLACNFWLCCSGACQAEAAPPHQQCDPGGHVPRVWQIWCMAQPPQAQVCAGTMTLAISKLHGSWYLGRQRLAWLAIDAYTVTTLICACVCVYVCAATGHGPHPGCRHPTGVEERRVQVHWTF